MRYKLISIIIATYNSQNTLSLALESVKRQTYPQNRLEILVIDGGSTDQTLKIARKFGCKIINNQKREPLFAKYLGFMKAKGDYILYLDSDEVIENPNSLKLKYLIFKKDNNIKAVIPSGYKVPPGYPSINFYINEFGDPFSFFIYKLSKDANYSLKALRNLREPLYENKDCAVFDFYNVKPVPIIELGAMGTMVDLKYLRKAFPQIEKNPTYIPFFFYLINNGSNTIAIAKEDCIFHYSSDTFKKYLKKIASRVKNSVYQTDMGKSGFLGRNRFQPFWYRFKKYLFIPYSYFLAFPLIDSLLLLAVRKRIIYLIHPLLCIYTASLIIYYYFLSIFGFKPKIKSYGN